MGQVLSLWPEWRLALAWVEISLLTLQSMSQLKWVKMPHGALNKVLHGFSLDLESRLGLPQMFIVALVGDRIREQQGERLASVLRRPSCSWSPRQHYPGFCSGLPPEWHCSKFVEWKKKRWLPFLEETGRWHQALENQPFSHYWIGSLKALVWCCVILPFIFKPHTALSDGEEQDWLMAWKHGLRWWARYHSSGLSRD